MRLATLGHTLILAALIAWGAPGLAQDAAFAGGWTLDAEGSTLGFQSVKNDTKVEMNKIATFTGTISPSGDAEVHVALDSIDTHIDLRNVRMRFLFFETFKFPQAVITTHIDSAVLADLPTKRRVYISLPVQLALHGVTKEITADVAVTLITPDMVSVASVGIIPIAAADFGMLENVTKLNEAAKVKVVPVGSVSFDWIFERNGSTATPVQTAGQTAVMGAASAKETQGTLDPDACKVRFATLSHAGNINFGSGSARLDVAGSAVLDTLIDVANRCPAMKVEIGGYTDDVGPTDQNLALSQRRAAAVSAYLAAKGVDGARLTAKGYGEDNPTVPNDSDENRGRNRRIEFKVLE